MTKHLESKKYIALDMISEITSARNPNREEDLDEIIRIFADRYEQIVKRKVTFAPVFTKMKNDETMHDIINPVSKLAS